MKHLKLKSLALILALFAGATFSSCSDEMSEISTESKAPKTSYSVNEAGFKLNFGLHRGKKWAKKHHTKPCKHSFGICSVKPAKHPNTTIKVPKVPTSNQNNKTIKLELIFLEPVDAKAGDIFFSNEDGAFTLPEYVSEYFGFNEMTIKPGDYTYQGPSKKYPNGYVFVNCEVN